ncbi:MAG: hypothetical protein ABIK65_16160 [Candidatus Eisenbacteria bacterium]
MNGVKIVGSLGSIALLILMAAPAPTQSLVIPPCISGNCTAEYAGDALGEWKYTIDVTWGPVDHGLSHLNLVLGFAGCECACDAFPFGAPDSAGYSQGSSGVAGAVDEPDTCRVRYSARYECHGDPSIPGDEGPLVKWEPEESAGCEPGPSGSGTLFFYTDWAPVAVGIPNQCLMFKYSTQSCSGELTGVLPQCTCGPTSTEATSWGGVKALFR